MAYAMLNLPLSSELSSFATAAMIRLYVGLGWWTAGIVMGYLQTSEGGRRQDTTLPLYSGYPNACASLTRRLQADDIPWANRLPLLNLFHPV